MSRPSRVLRLIQLTTVRIRVHGVCGSVISRPRPGTPPGCSGRGLEGVSEAAQPDSDGVRPVEDAVGPRDQDVLLVGCRADQQPGEAAGTQTVDGVEGRQVAEVISGEDDVPGADLMAQPLQHVALVGSVRPELDDLAAGLD